MLKVSGTNTETEEDTEETHMVIGITQAVAPVTTAVDITEVARDNITEAPAATTTVVEDITLNLIPEAVDEEEGTNTIADTDLVVDLTQPKPSTDNTVDMGPGDTREALTVTELPVTRTTTDIK
jgi:hypothetical protein